MSSKYNPKQHISAQYCAKQAAAPPSPHLVVLNITAYPSTPSVLSFILFDVALPLQFKGLTDNR